MLLQEMPNQFLGPWAQLGLFLIAVLFAWLTWRNRNWRSAAEAAQAACGVLKEEMSVHKERSDRLGVENRELIEVNAHLKARTDLQPLINVIKNWTEESRSHFLAAMTRLEKMNAEQAGAMESVQQALTALVSRIKEGSLTIGEGGQRG